MMIFLICDLDKIICIVFKKEGILWVSVRLICVILLGIGSLVL